MLFVFVTCCTENHLQYKCETLIFTDPEIKRPADQELPSQSSTDEEQELRGLAERMGQRHVHKTKEELKRQEDNKRGREKANKERRKNERKASTERGRGAEPQEANDGDRSTAEPRCQ